MQQDTPEAGEEIQPAKTSEDSGRRLRGRQSAQWIVQQFAQ